MTKVVSASDSRRFRSLLDLARRQTKPGLESFRSLYAIDLRQAVDLVMNESGWETARKTMQVSREQVERQEIVTVEDRNLFHSALFNPLRSRRVGPSASADPAEIIDRERAEQGCAWCDFDGWHVRNRGQWVDSFGDVLSDDGRVCARGNWARQAPLSGIVFGDERMHNLLRLKLDEFVSLFDTAERYIALARQSLTDFRYFLVFINGGFKSAGSVAHAHLQVVGRTDRHFGYPEKIAALCPLDYWEQVQRAHQELGLTVVRGAVTAWPSVAPVKDRDLYALSPTLAEGAIEIYALLQRLISHGTNSFSLAAILSPVSASAQDAEARFAKWPPVLWRLADRGDMRARHSDIGCMELFGSSVFATDPFDVAAWLSE